MDDSVIFQIEFHAPLNTTQVEQLRQQAGINVRDTTDPYKQVCGSGVFELDDDRLLILLTRHKSAWRITLSSHRNINRDNDQLRDYCKRLQDVVASF